MNGCIVLPFPNVRVASRAAACPEQRFAVSSQTRNEFAAPRDVETIPITDADYYHFLPLFHTYLTTAKERGASLSLRPILLFDCLEVT